MTLIDYEFFAEGNIMLHCDFFTAKGGGGGLPEIELIDMFLFRYGFLMEAGFRL